jgi:hypothetical protein
VLESYVMFGVKELIDGPSWRFPTRGHAKSIRLERLMIIIDLICFLSEKDSKEFSRPGRDKLF